MQEIQKRSRPPVRDHQYELETKRIRVAVKPAYLHDQSDPEDDRYVWSYTVTIENKGQEPVQLLSRYWNIIDGQGRIQEVRGAGVVGAQPVIAPGESFQYTSGCPLETASGTMSGRYEDLRRFLYDIETADELVYIEDVDLVPSVTHSDTLTFNIKIVTYLRGEVEKPAIVQ